MPTRVRIRLIDQNNARGTFILPTKDTVTWGIAAAISEDYKQLACPLIGQLALQLTSPVDPGLLGVSDTPLIRDVAVLTFESEGPFGLKVPIIGPKNIFLEDDVTIDLTNPEVMAWIATCLAWGTDRQGFPLVACKGGKRVGAGGP